VRKKVAVETDTGTRIIWNAVKKRKSLIDWEDFNLIFCKEIFREVLVSLASKIKFNSDSNLSGKDLALSA
jgi:hypothetical protein